ncbi:chemotaxis protein CheA [Sphingosinicella sp. LY1275]|uniref:chemotaxis protein CheA n=1 Tax=Sphingosinicella sp. LY1275 TaxID=3095379 RepID=UPI002ADEC285|nr:chemotaxis protein CheA [Sphingosinicella sp. LY1275]MEA1013331.1 chemotaxis protein CheA [Sphingosinicella sp. LY1275]
MEDLINDFIAETREMLEALGGEIVAWESAPNDRARLDEIFRFVHTVKGNCGFFDLPRLEALSHAAEDALVEVRSGRRSADHGLVSAVLAIIDRIGELVQALETGESIASADDRQLIDALSDKPSPVAETADAVAGPAVEVRKSFRSIRLSVDLLDRMMSGVSDMVLARNELARRLREAPTDVAVEAAFDRVSACIAEMRDAITRTRMQRIDNLFVTLPRMVRDLSAELGKQVALEVDGGDVELDREMIEMIRDPLSHIVRNSVDHGIESAEERTKAGKAATGTLRVAARQAGNQILIEIADNGRGIDSAKLVRKAVANGVITPEQGERLSPAQRNSLIFEAGLSTAQQVTSISGRGVGMDVVRANIERIGGVVDVESKLGQGVRLTLRVPLTLTIIPALTVSIGGQNYAIPRSAIEEIVRSKNSSVRIETVGGAQVASIRDKRIPLVSLGAVLEVEQQIEAAEQTMIVLKPAGGDVYALAVDHVHDHEELVVKPAAPVVMATGLYAGTTLADDGIPILLLDPSGIAAAAGVVLDQTEIEKRTAAPAPEEEQRVETPALLFVTLGGARRAIHLPVVERIEDAKPEAVSCSAGRLRVVIGDRILPLAGISEAPDQPFRILRLSDGVSELAYAFAEVVDIVGLTDAMLPAPAAGEVSGVTLIDGVQVEIVDSYWLFGAHGHDVSDAKVRPVCALPSGDPWMENILRPIIEGAGYRVVPADSAEAQEVDVLITSAEAEPVPLVAGQIVKIRAHPEPNADHDDSIYRYDRAGLLSALSRVAGRKG